MGKAARQRRRRRVQYLVNLSFSEPEKFADSWERRIDSWLVQVRTLSCQWAKGRAQSGDMKIFDFVDEAMEILSQCDEPVRKKYAHSTYEVLSHECSVQVAGITNRHLYRVSSFHESLRLSEFYQPKQRSVKNE